MATITATAPTSYQLASLRLFGMPITSHGNGSHTASQEFDTVEEAKSYLIERAEMFFDGNSDNDEERLADAIDRVNKHGSLYLDAAYASIEE